MPLLLYKPENSKVMVDHICGSPMESWLEHLGAEAAMLFGDDASMSYYLKVGVEFGETIWRKSGSLPQGWTTEDHALRMIDKSWTPDEVQRMADLMGEDFPVGVCKSFADWYTAVQQ